MMNNRIKLGAILVAGAVGLSSCGKDKGDIVTETLNIDNFTKVELDGSWDVFIEQGSTQSVVVTGHENVIADLNRSVSGGEWEIDVDENYDNAELTVYISIPTLESADLDGSGSIEIAAFNNLNNLDIELSGSGDIITTGNLDIESILDLDLSGSGEISLEANADVVKSEITGSGDIELFGESTSQSISKSGSGNYRAIDFTTATTVVNLTGSGDAYVNVNDLLTVNITGSGDVYYVGQPVIDFNNNGSGDLINQN